MISTEMYIRHKDAPARIAQILREAADVVERGWTQKKLARDADDKPVTVITPKACRFCLVGAIHRVVWDHRMSLEWQDAAEQAVYRYLFGHNRPIVAQLDVISTLGNWNDVEGRTVDEVVGVLHNVADRLEHTR